MHPAVTPSPTSISPWHRSSPVVTRSLRERLHGHVGRVVWLTGLSGSGKSTLAQAFEAVLHSQGLRSYVLDGDQLRHGLNRDLGFNEADRTENIRRAAEVARMFVDAGVIVITAFISPLRSQRDAARALFAPGDFLEVFVSAPLAVTEARDPKGLYRKARSGQLPQFTGIDAPYEPPLNPELVLPTHELAPDACVRRLMALLNTPSCLPT